MVKPASGGVLAGVSGELESQAGRDEHRAAGFLDHTALSVFAGTSPFLYDRLIHDVKQLVLHEANAHLSDLHKRFFLYDITYAPADFLSVPLISGRHSYLHEVHVAPAALVLEVDVNLVVVRSYIRVFKMLFYWC